MQRRRRRIVLGTGALALFAAGTWWAWRGFGSTGPGYDAAIREAKTLIAAGALNRARGLLAETAARSPARGEAQFLMGACEQALGRRDAAVAAWSQVPEGSTFGPPAALFLCAAFLQADRLADARAAPLRRALVGPRGRWGRGPARRSFSSTSCRAGRRGGAGSSATAGSNTRSRVGTLQQLWRLRRRPPAPGGASRGRRARREVGAGRRPGLAGPGRPGGPDGSTVSTRRAAGSAPARPRRPDDPAVWRARLDWARRRPPGRGPGPRRGRHLPADRLCPRGGPGRSAAWLGRRSPGTRGRAQGPGELVATPARRPRGPWSGSPGWPSRPAGGGRGRPAPAPQGRDSTAPRTATGARMVGPTRRPTPAELAAPGRALGRWFEARGWWALAARRLARRPRGPRRPGPAGARRPRPRRPPPAGVLAESRPRPPSGPARPDRPPSGPGPCRPSSTTPRPPGSGSPTTTAGPAARQLPETMGGGVGLLDYDGDGWLDVYCVQGGPFPPDARPARAAATACSATGATARSRTSPSRRASPRFPGGYGHGVAVGDFDNDGHPDLFVTRWRSYALYRNRGDGTFEDATEARRPGRRPRLADLGGLRRPRRRRRPRPLRLPLPAPGTPSTRRSAATRATGQQSTTATPRRSTPLPDHLFRNDGGRFVDVTAEAGHRRPRRPGPGRGRRRPRRRRPGRPVRRQRQDGQLPVPQPGRASGSRRSADAVGRGGQRRRAATRRAWGSPAATSTATAGPTWP